MSHRRKPAERTSYEKLVGMHHAPRTQCDRRGKKAYATRSAARTAAGRMRQRFGHEQEPYRCRDCKFYHLTTARAHG